MQHDHLLVHDEVRSMLMATNRRVWMYLYVYQRMLHSKRFELLLLNLCQSTLAEKSEIADPHTNHVVFLDNIFRAVPVAHVILGYGVFASALHFKMRRAFQTVLQRFEMHSRNVSKLCISKCRRWAIWRCPRPRMQTLSDMAMPPAQSCSYSPSSSSFQTL